tara:strand:- start:9884 stop:10603 length:720 start_codon:yes stop_codon:yes gene_type:complete
MRRIKIDREIYKKINTQDEPKELFKQVVKIMGFLKDNNLKNKKLIDIGGANGAFCGYIRSLNKDISITNSDYNSDILNNCKFFFKENKIIYKKGDANSLTEKSNFYDYVTSFGVTSIFDEFIPSFSEMIRIAKPKGVICNSMIVNESRTDVIIKYLDPKTGEHIPGWNKFSISSISNYLSKNKHVESFDFIKHKMPFDIKKKIDPMRSYTRNINGERVLWNDGLQMEIPVYCIIIKKIE